MKVAPNIKIKRWYALYVNVRHEKKVMMKLLERGIEAYVPLIKQIKQWSDRKKMIELPLFTGYVFVNIALSEMDKLRWVEGVINYLRFEGKPAVIRDNEIEGLKYFVSNGYEINSEDNYIGLGQKVKINLAQFKDFTGTVKSISENDFVAVSFEGIRQDFILKVPRGAVKMIR